MFKDFNFKLTVIAELMETEEFKNQLVAEISKLPKKSKEKHTPIPERLQYVQNLELNEKTLASVTRFSPCTLHEIYKLLMPDWKENEIDEQFFISSLEDILQLPNIDTLDLFELCHPLDLKPLLKLDILKKLKYVDIDAELVKPADKEVIEFLKSKKLKVYVQ